MSLALHEKPSVDVAPRDEKTLVGIPNFLEWIQAFESGEFEILDSDSMSFSSEGAIETYQGKAAILAALRAKQTRLYSLAIPLRTEQLERLGKTIPLAEIDRDVIEHTYAENLGDGRVLLYWVGDSEAGMAPALVFEVHVPKHGGDFGQGYIEPEEAYLITDESIAYVTDGTTVGQQLLEASKTSTLERDIRSYFSSEELAVYPLFEVNGARLDFEELIAYILETFSPDGRVVFVPHENSVSVSNEQGQTMLISAVASEQLQEEEQNAFWKEMLHAPTKTIADKIFTAIKGSLEMAQNAKIADDQKMILASNLEYVRVYSLYIQGGDINKLKTADQELLKEMIAKQNKVSVSSETTLGFVNILARKYLGSFEDAVNSGKGKRIADTVGLGELYQAANSDEQILFVHSFTESTQSIVTAVEAQVQEMYIELFEKEASSRLVAPLSHYEQQELLTYWPVEVTPDTTLPTRWTRVFNEQGVELKQTTLGALAGAVWKDVAKSYLEADSVPTQATIETDTEAVRKIPEAQMRAANIKKMTDEFNAIRGVMVGAANFIVTFKQVTSESDLVELILETESPSHHNFIECLAKFEKNSHGLPRRFQQQINDYARKLEATAAELTQTLAIEDEVSPEQFDTDIFPDELNHTVNTLIAEMSGSALSLALVQEMTELYVDQQEFRRMYTHQVQSRLVAALETSIQKYVLTVNIRKSTQEELISQVHTLNPLLIGVGELLSARLETAVEPLREQFSSLYSVGGYQSSLAL